MQLSHAHLPPLKLNKSTPPLLLLPPVGVHALTGDFPLSTHPSARPTTHSDTLHPPPISWTGTARGQSSAGCISINRTPRGDTISISNPHLPGARERTFDVDVAFDQHATQGKVYDETAKRLLEKLLAGYNTALCCCESGSRV